MGMRGSSPLFGEEAGEVDMSYSSFNRETGNDHGPHDTVLALSHPARNQEAATNVLHPHVPTGLPNGKSQKRNNTSHDDEEDSSVATPPRRDSFRHKDAALTLRPQSRTSCVTLIDDSDIDVDEVDAHSHPHKLLRPSYEQDVEVVEDDSDDVFQVDAPLEHHELRHAQWAAADRIAPTLKKDPQLKQPSSAIVQRLTQLVLQDPSYRVPANPGPRHSTNYAHTNLEWNLRHYDFSVDDLLAACQYFVTALDNHMHRLTRQQSALQELYQRMFRLNGAAFDRCFPLRDKARQLLGFVHSLQIKLGSDKTALDAFVSGAEAATANVDAVAVKKVMLQAEREREHMLETLLELDRTIAFWREDVRVAKL